MPSDVVEKLGLHNNSEDLLSIELKITSKPRRFFHLNEKVKSFIKNPNVALFDIKELKNLGFDGNHKTSIKVKMNGNSRTIDLSETGQIRPYYDIDSEVKKDEGGHPIFESINSVAKELVNDLYNELFI